MNKGVKEYFTKSRVIVDFVLPAIGYLIGSILCDVFAIREMIRNPIGNIAARVGIILAAMLVVEGLVFGIGMLVNREKTLALFNIGIDEDDDDDGNFEEDNVDIEEGDDNEININITI
ncbi:MAG: hypothetical protein K6E27_09365 [Eubacterium sp.]|nr:hypothetical protein [Eubacterium sp.]